MTMFLKLRDAAGGIPVVCVPGAGATALAFGPLCRRLSPEHPVLIVHPSELAPGYGRNLCVTERAERCVRSLTKERPRGPYALLGHSFGGVVALEMARLLCAAGQEVITLAMLDTPLRRSLIPLSKGDVELFETLTQASEKRFAASKDGLDELMKQGLKRIVQLGHMPEGLPEDMGRSLLLQWISDLRALVAYDPVPYDDTVVHYFVAGERKKDEDPHPQLAWVPKLKAGLTIYQARADHNGILKEPYVQDLAMQLERLIGKSA